MFILQLREQKIGSRNFNINGLRTRLIRLGTRLMGGPQTVLIDCTVLFNYPVSIVTHCQTGGEADLCTIID